MGAFFVYILKSAVCLAGFYLFYRLLLSHDTFHRFNRVALLSLLVLSCTVPLVEVTVEQPTGVEQPFLTLEEMMLLTQWEAPAQSDVAVVPSITWREVVLLLYALGIVFFLLRNVWSLVRMLRLIKGSTVQEREDGITLITHRKRIAPFSWMRYIVISEKDLVENGREILAHECAHIRNCHSIDLLVADVCIFFQWFNPAAWLLKQELQNIHEYEADESVIAQGIDAKSYQLLLIKKAVGTRLYSMANSFNHSSLKKRITMMMKKKSNPWARAKYLYVLPLAAVAVAAFARPEVSNELKEISAVKVNDLTAIMKAEEVKSIENVATSDEKVVKINGKVVEMGAGALPNVSILIKGTKAGTLTDATGNFTLQVSVGSTLVFSYADIPAKELEVTEKMDNLPLLMVLMKENGKEEFKYAANGSVHTSNVVEVSVGQNEEGKQTFQVVEDMPEFPGGMAECMKWLGNNVRYPVEAQKNGVQGRVIVQFVVETDGSICETKVVRSVSPEIDAEALRVVNSMPKWKPGMQRGKAVRVKYTMPVMFRLNDDKTEGDAQPAVTEAASAEAGEQVFQVVEHMPEFPGGMAECLKFLTNNVRYPVEAQTNNIQGRVIVQFIVEKDGSITSPVVVRGIEPSLDAEAIRVVGMMPKWKPGTQRGKAVRVKYTVPIMFRLQDFTPAADSTKVVSITTGKDNYLVFIDGVKGDRTTLQNMKPTNNMEVHVMSEKNAIAKYGEEGKNGAVIVTTKK